MASPTLKLLVQIQSDLSGLNAAVAGLQKLQQAAADTHKAGFTLGDAFKFAGVEEGLHRIIDGVQELAKGMADLAKESINAAAEIQQEKFFLSELIGGIGRANEMLDGLHSIWQEIGIVSDEAITRAATALSIIGVPLQNIQPMIVEFSKVFAATNVELSDLISGYQRFTQAIEHNNEAFVRGASAFGLSSLLIRQMLQDFLKLPQGEEGIARLGNMFKAGTVSVQQLDDAIRAATTTGGKFDDAIERRKQQFKGAVLEMMTAWRGLQAELGTPIIEALTPVINRITDIEKAFAKIAEEKGWQVAVRLAWEIVIDEVAQLWTVTLRETFSKLGPAIAAGWFGAWEALNREFGAKGFTALKNENIKQWGSIMGEGFTKAFAAAFGSNLGPEMEARRADLESALNNIFQDLNVRQGIGPPIEPGDQAKRDAGKVDMTRQLTAALHDLEGALAGVHQTQTLIAAQPFMGIDEKQRELIQSYEKEIVKIQAGIERLNALSATGLLSKPQMAEVATQVQRAGNQIDILRQKVAGLQQDFRKSLQDWANSFGSTGHQLANTLQQTVGAALNSINQYLVTGKFNAQALLQQIVLLGLQLIEQMAIQQVIAIINAHANAALAAATGTTIATAMAPAATAMTIATEGGAAAAAPAEIAAALAATMAILVAHEGGVMSRRRFHGGGLAADEIPIIAQEGEIMIRRGVAQQPGMADFLLGLNDGMFHSGGFIRRMHGGGDEFDPERWADPNPGLGQRGGLQWRTSDIPGFWGDVYNPYEFGGYSNMMNRWLMGQGFSGPIGTPGWLQGPTMIPTTFNVQGYPRAVPLGPSSDINLARTGHFPRRLPKHEGGLISRMHSGGAVSGGGGSGGGIHIYAFTDLKALTKHMGSKEGQKIIFDTVNGRRIDLGIK